MLRITVRNQTGIRIVLEGKLASVWVNELKNCCKDVLSRSDPGKVSLELADVSFVDAGGKRFLAELSHEGVHLISGSIATDALVEDITKNVREGHEAIVTARAPGQTSLRMNSRGTGTTSMKNGGSLPPKEKS
ncbi:MAG: hypothetical protein ABSD88_10610 [Candidatus Korobacteraceae bacterium]|jgi:ABC-type transporter Mla MlaB component